MYDFYRIQSITFDLIWLKVKALGYFGLKSLYYRILGVPMDTRMISIKNQRDIQMMINYGKISNDKICLVC